MDQRVQKIQQLMRDNLQREWSLAELARTVNLSVWRLSHIFASEMRQSPIHYLRQLRMDRAKYLLETSFLSVKEIMHQVGLTDPSHFVRDFKKAHGDPPARYRSRFRRARKTESSYDNEPKLSEVNSQLAKAAKRSVLIFLNFLGYFSEFGVR